MVPPYSVRSIRRIDVQPLVKELGGAPVRYFAEWTDRIAKGELPHAKPERPQGVERNIVVTTWDWLNEKHYLHDLIASDRRYPTVNAYGPVYGSTEYSVDLIPVLDPKKHVTRNLTAPIRDPNTPEALGPGHAASDKIMQPSPYWGTEKIWDTKANNHNAMFDRKGRVWFAARFRDADNPAYCKKGSDHPSAKVFPMDRTNRQLTILDPKTGQYTYIDTCFRSHHLQFGYDANETLWTSGGGPVVGWVNTKMLDETGDIAKSQGWTPMILDTNGNGKRDEYVEANQPVDPTKDKRIIAGFYAVMPSPVDGSIWGSYGQSGCCRAARSRNQSDRDRAHRDLQCANARLRHSWRRHRPPRRRLGFACERSPRQFRPAQVQRAAQRAKSDRRSLSRRAGRFISILVPDSKGSERTAPSRATTLGSISTTHSAWARTCRCPPAT